MKKEWTLEQWHWWQQDKILGQNFTSFSDSSQVLELLSKYDKSEIYIKKKKKKQIQNSFTFLSDFCF